MLAGFFSIRGVLDRINAPCATSQPPDSPELVAAILTQLFLNLLSSLRYGVIVARIAIAGSTGFSLFQIARASFQELSD